MHPILAHRHRRRAYLIGWLPVAALLAALAVQGGDVQWSTAAILALPLTIVLAFALLSGWYLCRTLPLEGTEPLRLALSHGLAALVSATVWTLLAASLVLVVAHLVGDPELPTRLAGLAPALVAIGIVLYAAAIAVHYAVASFEAARLAERAALQREALARQAELKALRAQVDPHFLYNSLNAIGGLTVSDSAAARQMCVLLAGFFRDTVRLGGERSVPLAAEIALLRSFLAIEKVRFGERLRVSESIDDDALPLQVPPLLLQPVVENAVTHGIATLPAGGAIGIVALRRGGTLEIEISNDCDPDTAATGGEGVGLDNVRRRLASHYGTRARVRVHREPRSYRVTVSLPAERDRDDAESGGTGR